MRRIEILLTLSLFWTGEAVAQVGGGGVPPFSARAATNVGKSEPERASQLQVTTTAVYSGTLQRAPWAAWKEDDDEP
jgi:hypothetical protein